MGCVPLGIRGSRVLLSFTPESLYTQQDCSHLVYKPLTYLTVPEGMEELCEVVLCPARRC